MKVSRLVRGIVGMGAVLLSGVASAAEGGADASGTVGFIAIGAGLAMGLAALGGALGQGATAGKALEGLARNPGSKDQVFTPMLLALALIEFQAIMGFVVALMLAQKI